MIQSQLDILKQGEALLREITSKEFTWTSKEYQFNSIGKHFRHIIDHYQSLQEAQLTGFLDYDHRSRGCDVESQPDCALGAWLSITDWLENLDTKLLSMPLKLSTEISIHEQNVYQVATSLDRELIYLGNHTVHHFALIAMAMCLQGRRMNPNFSLAPATATHQRNQQTSTG